MTRRQRRPWTNPALGWVLVNLISPGIIILPLVLLAWYGRWDKISSVLLLAVVSGMLRSLGKSISGAAMDKSQAPVVYLREFSDEGSLSQIGHMVNNFSEENTFEEHLQRALSPIGPFVGLGKPGTWLQKTGAAREYVEDDRWKEKIVEMIDQACLVVIQAGSSDNLLWEMSEVVKRKSPAAILIYIGSRIGLSGDSFRNAALGLRFPEREELWNGLFLWFNSSGDPVVLRADKRPFLTLKPQVLFDLETALEPVVQYFAAIRESAASP